MPEWGSLGIPRFLFPKPVPTRGFVGANPIPTGDNGERRIPGFKAKLSSEQRAVSAPVFVQTVPTVKSSPAFTHAFPFSLLILRLRHLLLSANTPTLVYDHHLSLRSTDQSTETRLH